MELSAEIYEYCMYFDASLEQYLVGMNESTVYMEANASMMLAQCDEIMEYLMPWETVLQLLLRVLMAIGLLLNLFVMGVLLLDNAKTSSDFYLISICVGDITICVGALITTELMEYFPSLCLNAIGQIIGNLG